ncbi:hypothetical protein QF001_007737 [Paraburkholderia youngii]|uniref:hypothetical protein n=1 Tax=Paraburkholderia youngii TaxID=2782701 RepID=UPI003D1DB92C
MTYLRIGYGLHPGAKGCWGLVVDLGVVYRIPKTSYTLSSALSQASGPEMTKQIINTGLQQLRNKASPFRWYPTLQLGISYRFRRAAIGVRRSTINLQRTFHIPIAHKNARKKARHGYRFFWLFIEMKRYAMIAAGSAEHV